MSRLTSELPIYQVSRSVEAHEIDELNHVNNVVYVQWANDIAIEHWQNVGTPEMLSNYGWVLLKHCIEYKAPAVLGDSVLIKTQVGRATNVKYQRFIEIYNATSMKLLASSTTDWCAINKDGKPTRITPEIRSLFEASI
ncbi:MAG: thioesterase family protein [Nonlabens sp.]